MRDQNQSVVRTGPLIVCPATEDNWVLTEDWPFEGHPNGRTVCFAVPEGFVTDFASIPRLLWPLLPKWGDYGWAAVLHDYLYWEQSLCREDSDAILLEAMMRSSVPPWRRQLIYRAVRLFGCWAWNSNRRRKMCGENRMAPKHSDNLPFMDFQEKTHAKVVEVQRARLMNGKVASYVFFGVFAGIAAGAIVRGLRQR
jgi:uncharacterized protein DUF1353